MKIECPNCNAAFEVEAKYVGRQTTCSACGNDFEIKNPNLTECPDCFASISKRALFCPHCGAGLKMSSFASAPSSVPAVESNEPEETLQACHPAALNYLADIIIGIILIPVFLIGVFILVSVWIKICRTSYTITNRRIIITSGWLSKEQHEIWIKDMRGASMSQGMLQRLFGLGNVAIGTAATGGTEIMMIGVAGPQEIVDLVNSLR